MVDDLFHERFSKMQQRVGRRGTCENSSTRFAAVFVRLSSTQPLPPHHGAVAGLVDPSLLDTVARIEAYARGRMVEDPSALLGRLRERDRISEMSSRCPATTHALATRPGRHP